MPQLSVEEMDDINVLLTEVSLELLGNQFYDIFGQQRETLRELYRGGIEKRPGYSMAPECDLMKQLDANDKNRLNENIAPVDQADQVTTAPPTVMTSSSRSTASGSTDGQEKTKKGLSNKRKSRGADSTDRLSKTVTSNSVPIEIDQPAEPVSLENDDPPVAPLTEAERLKAIETEIKTCVARGENRNNVRSQSKLTVFYPSIELNLKKSVSERLKIQYLLQHHARMDSEYMDEYELVSEFHAKEKNQLMTDSHALIQMVNTIKFDTQNAHKIAEISANILHVKDFL